MRAVFVGPPGSGKGTQAKLLRERLGLAYIGTGDILRDARDRGTEWGKKVAPLLAAGQLVPDSLVNDLIAELLRRPDAPKEFILDGYPRTTTQAVALDGLLRELGLDLRAVVHFKIDEDVVVRRLVGRLAQERRLDDGEETVRHRLRVFRDTSRELLDHYRKQGIVHDVEAEDTIENLYTTIANLLRTRPS
jgi:adenylate kinase